MMLLRRVLMLLRRKLCFQVRIQQRQLLIDLSLELGNLNIRHGLNLLMIGTELSLLLVSLRLDLNLLLLALLLSCCALQASAKDAAPATEDPVLERRVQTLSQELRCLVCQNQTIADSQAQLALDLKQQEQILLQDLIS